MVENVVGRLLLRRRLLSQRWQHAEQLGRAEPDAIAAALTVAVVVDVIGRTHLKRVSQVSLDRRRDRGRIGDASYLIGVLLSRVCLSELG